jgi:hypothetical protein
MGFVDLLHRAVNHFCSELGYTFKDKKIRKQLLNTLFDRREHLWYEFQSKVMRNFSSINPSKLVIGASCLKGCQI